MTTTAAEGKTIFGGGCWVFAKSPSIVALNAGDEGEEWVPAPSVRIQGTVSVEDEETGDTYDETYTMSISPSYVGPVITYYGMNDGGVPMKFALATTTQDSEVTAAIEALLSGDGIENIEHGTLNMNNGAIYNLQGQRVNKAQKGVFIQNGKKVVLK